MHTFLWVDVADAGAQREEEAFFNGAIKSMIIKWLIYLAKIWWESHLTSLTG